MKDTAERKPHMGIFILLVAVVSAAVILLSVNVQEITVTGSSRYTDEELISLIFPKAMDLNSAWLFVRERTKEHIQIPFVEDYQLDFAGPTHVEIIVHEKSVVGCVSYMGSYMYFDKDGIIVESTPEALEGIPCILGLRFGQIVLHQPLPVEDNRIFEEILNLTQLLSVHELSVDKIQYSSKGAANLYFGNVEVVLGDSSRMDAKISALADMMHDPEVRERLLGLDGTLYLDNYDETKEDMISTFKKNLKE